MSTNEEPEVPLNPLMLLYITDHLDGKKSECFRLYSYLTYRSSSIERLHGPLNLTNYKVYYSSLKLKQVKDAIDAQEFENQCFFHLQNWNTHVFGENDTDNDVTIKNLIHYQPLDKQQFVSNFSRAH